MCTARTGRVCKAELIGVEQKRVRVVDFQDLLFAVEAILLLRESVDQAVAKRAGKCAVLSLSCLDFVDVCILVLLDFSFVFVL